MLVSVERYPTLSKFFQTEQQSPIENAYGGGFIESDVLCRSNVFAKLSLRISDGKIEDKLQSSGQYIIAESGNYCTINTRAQSDVPVDIETHHEKNRSTGYTHNM